MDVSQAQQATTTAAGATEQVTAALGEYQNEVETATAAITSALDAASERLSAALATLEEANGHTLTAQQNTADLKATAEAHGFSSAQPLATALEYVIDAIGIHAHHVDQLTQIQVAVESAKTKSAEAMAALTAAVPDCIGTADNARAALEESGTYLQAAGNQ